MSAELLDEAEKLMRSTDGRPMLDANFLRVAQTLALISIGRALDTLAVTREPA